MKNMQSFKENRDLLFLAFLVLFSSLYLDTPLLLWIKDFHNRDSFIYSVLKSIDPAVGFASNGATLIAGSFLLYILFRRSNLRLSDAGKTLFAGLISSGILVQILKHLIGKSRPRITDNPFFIGPSLKSGFDSFPSGHATLAFSFACILTYHFPKYRAVFYAFAVITGFERFEDANHFLSDVLAGAFLGIVVARFLLAKVSPKGEKQACQT